MATQSKHGPGRLVLVADDDPQILRLVRMTLEADGYVVLVAKNGEEAVQLFLSERPDVAILDLSMPDYDGLETMHRIHEYDGSVPTIILTARSGAVDVTRALDSGADDYVTKPFHPDILISRVGAVLRRVANREYEQHEGAPLLYERVLIDLANRKVEVDGDDVRFSPTEWDLLFQLASNPGRVMLRTELISRVWGAEFRDEHHRLRLSVSRLRNKLEENPDEPTIISTIRGIGYRLEPPSGPADAHASGG